MNFLALLLRIFLIASLLIFCYPRTSSAIYLASVLHWWVFPCIGAMWAASLAAIYKRVLLNHVLV